MLTGTTVSHSLVRASSDFADEPANLIRHPIAHLQATPDPFQEPKFSYQELYNMTNSFWDAFMFPANVVQADLINSTILSDDVIGRVDDTRVFVGRELNTEYLFGYFAQLALLPSAVSLIGSPINHTAIHFAATQNVVSSSQIVYFNISLIGLAIPVELDVWVTFNAKGEISQYDATIRWFAQIYDLLFAEVRNQLDLVHSTQSVVEHLTEAIAKQVCATSAEYCNGTNQQYSSSLECVRFLTEKVRLGRSYELGGNTLLCRSIHEIMVPFRPSVHCPHIGPTGGEMCVDDVSYAQKVQQMVFTNSPFVLGEGWGL